MRYSEICLQKALITVFPDSGKWPLSINIPTRLDMAAIEIFLYPEKFNTMDGSFSQLVIKKALTELRIDGWITYGKTDDFWL